MKSLFISILISYNLVSQIELNLSSDLSNQNHSSFPLIEKVTPKSNGLSPGEVQIEAPENQPIKALVDSVIIFPLGTNSFCPPIFEFPYLVFRKFNFCICLLT